MKAKRRKTSTNIFKKFSPKQYLLTNEEKENLN